jgi:CRP-like cAMP-binding protein
VILEIFGEGEPVGSIAVYNYMPYPASAIALEDVSILALPRGTTSSCSTASRSSRAGSSAS